MYFFQVAKTLVELLSEQDAVASDLFKGAANLMKGYNKQITTMEKTRQILKGMMSEENFEDWDNM